MNFQEIAKKHFQEVPHIEVHRFGHAKEGQQFIYPSSRHDEIIDRLEDLNLDKDPFTNKYITVPSALILPADAQSKDHIIIVAESDTTAKIIYVHQDGTLENNQPIIIDEVELHGTSEQHIVPDTTRNNLRNWKNKIDLFHYSVMQRTK